MEFVLIGFGGALGSIARYKIGNIISSKSKSSIPVGTFIINITGAFLLGILSGANTNRSISLFFADGFLGAYTTFSTFMYESFTLFKDKKLNAAVYIISSIVLGILGFAVGFLLGSKFF